MTSSETRLSVLGADLLAQPGIRLNSLRIEHDDLDAAIAALLREGGFDDLLVTRLKKRKLQIKDEIAWAIAADLPMQARAS